MIGRLFTWSTPYHRPSTITGRPALYRTEEDLDAALEARRSLTRGQKGWRSRRAGQ